MLSCLIYFGLYKNINLSISVLFVIPIAVGIRLQNNVNEHKRADLCSIRKSRFIRSD